MPCKDRESQRAFQREWLKKRRAARLAESSCVRCGSRRDLQVDHIDQTKKVSHNVWSWTAKVQMKLAISTRPLCPCVMEGHGENEQQCLAECYYTCDRHDDPIDGCTKSCMRMMGCSHVPQYVAD